MQVYVNSVGPSGVDQCRCKGFSLFHPFAVEQFPAICPFSHLNCNFQEMSKDTFVLLFLT